MPADLSVNRVIIDASYLRASPADGSMLRGLANCGARLVLIDNLVYELCSTENRDQWPASQRKLAACVESIECWEHTAQMLRYEMENRQPYGEPRSEDITQSFRQMLRSEAPYVSPDLDEVIRQSRQQREEDSVPALFRAMDGIASLLSDNVRECLRGQPPDQIGQMCSDVVANETLIRRLTTGGSNPCFPGSIDDSWLAWHHYKAVLCATCEWIRQDCPRFEDLGENARHRWINRKHDLDYLIALSRADAIATAETNGEMLHFCRWMFGNSKTVITPSDG